MRESGKHGGRILAVAGLNGDLSGHVRKFSPNLGVRGGGLAAPEFGLSPVLVEGGTEETAQALGFGRRGEGCTGNVGASRGVRCHITDFISRASERERRPGDRGGASTSRRRAPGVP